MPPKTFWELFWGPPGQNGLYNPRGLLIQLGGYPVRLTNYLLVSAAFGSSGSPKCGVACALTYLLTYFIEVLKRKYHDFESILGMSQTSVPSMASQRRR